MQDAGIEARQAEAIALAFKRSQSDLATKADNDYLRIEVKEVIKQVKADIEQLRIELKGDFRWLKWSIAAMNPVMIGGFGIIISLLR